MDDVSLSSVGRLFQMTAADTANALTPTTVLVRRTDSFTVSAERRRRRPATRDQDAVVCQVRRSKTVNALKDDDGKLEQLNCIRCWCWIGRLRSTGVMWSNFLVPVTMVNLALNIQRGYLFAYFTNLHRQRGPII